MRAARLGSAALLRSCHSIDLASHSQPHYLYLISTRPFWGLCRFPHTPCRDAWRQRSRERSPWPGWDHGTCALIPSHSAVPHITLGLCTWCLQASSGISQGAVGSQSFMRALPAELQPFPFGPLLPYRVCTAVLLPIWVLSAGDSRSGYGQSVGFVKMHFPRDQ